MMRLKYISCVYIIILFSSLLYSQTDTMNCKQLWDSVLKTKSLEEGVWEWTQLPSIIGGTEQLQKNLDYPIKAKQHNVEGKVYVIVIVDTTGLPICPRILSGKLGYGCNDAAIKAVMKCKFKPASFHSKRKRAPISISVEFTLHK